MVSGLYFVISQKKVFAISSNFVLPLLVLNAQAEIFQRTSSVVHATSSSLLIRQPNPPGSLAHYDHENTTARPVRRYSTGDVRTEH